MKELYKAISNAKNGFSPIKKSCQNPYFKSKYADLDIIWESINKSLSDNNLLVLQPTKGYELITQIIYTETGDMIESSYPLPHIEEPQKLGSALTYARRYALCSFLNLIADEDDDGNMASNSNHAPQNTNSGVITEAQARRLYAISKENNVTTEQSKLIVASFGYGSSKDILKKDYEAICAKFQSVNKPVDDYDYSGM